MSIWRDMHEHSLGKPRKEEKDIYVKVFETILGIKPWDSPYFDLGQFYTSIEDDVK